MWPSTGIRFILTIAPMTAWSLRKADVKSSFLQTASAQQTVYVIPPRECTERRFLWLLDSVTYGLVISNAKWQKQYDKTFYKLGMTQCPFIPQLFYVQNVHGNLVVSSAKIVDDILIKRLPAQVSIFITAFNDRFKLGSVPGKLRFYKLNIVPKIECSSMVDADDKLSSLETCPLTRDRCRLPEDNLTPVEKSICRSFNSSIGWLGIAAAPLCSLYWSYLQQRSTINNVISLAYSRHISRF